MGSGKGRQRRALASHSGAAVAARPWYVITGVPSSGKTTQLKDLRHHAEDSHDEAARTIIDEGLAAGKTLEEVRGDERDFNRIVAERTWQREHSADPGIRSLFDRGLPDLMAWARIHGSEVPEGLPAEVRGWRYNKVFLLEPLPVFEQDGVRIEDKEFNARLHEELLKAYTEVGEEVVVVPVASVEERTEFILSHLDSGDDD